MEKKFDNFLFNASVDKSNYFIAKYFIKSNNMLKAAKGVAIGQSIGNPDVRLDNETAKLVNSFEELNDERDAALAYFIQATVITSELL